MDKKYYFLFRFTSDKRKDQRTFLGFIRDRVQKPQAVLAILSLALTSRSIGVREEWLACEQDARPIVNYQPLIASFKYYESPSLVLRRVVR